MSLTFNERNHSYRLDGKPCPGVTGLLSGGIPKPALTYWAARTVAEYVADHDAEVEQLRGMGRASMVAALKEVPWTQRDEAAAKGTEVHALADRLAHGEEVEVPDHIAGHVDGYVRFLDLWQPRTILTEFRCASRQWWYAGTGDLLAEIDGVVFCLDVKASRGVYGETASQTAAYSRSEFFMAEDGTEQPMPPVERLAVLHVREDGTDLLPVADPEAAWKTFLHAAWLAKQKDRIKAQIGEPMRHPSETEDSAA